MVKFLRLVLVLLLAMVCLAFASGALLVEFLPRRATQVFGPPSTNLSLIQRTIYSYRLLSNEKKFLSPLEDHASSRLFLIESGESVNSISTRLEEEGFISNADTFRTYLIYSGLDTRVQAGKFQLSPSMSPLQIAGRVMDPIPEDVTFNILPGWRAEEIAASLPTSGLLVTEQEFIDLIKNPPADIFPPGMEPEESLEGFLMPGSYEVKREISARELVGVFLNRFHESVPQDLRDGFTNHGLSLREAVILASIIQREAMVDDEQPLMASVFYNRLAAGMRLESDPTVQYSLGYQFLKNVWWKNPLTREDLGVDSRYNTYMYPGLPPGPISNPSISALQAVANPAQTDYYFFRARCDGSGRHFFAVTYDEHLNNACP
jgi:UPF0755 protein